MNTVSTIVLFLGLQIATLPSVHAGDRIVVSDTGALWAKRLLGSTDINFVFPRWSQRFDRSLDDVFAIQDEIAASVAASLRRTIAARGSTCVPGCCSGLRDWLVASGQGNSVRSSSRRRKDRTGGQKVRRSEGQERLTRCDRAASHEKLFRDGTVSWEVHRR
jgi:hypothetical protein